MDEKGSHIGNAACGLWTSRISVEHSKHQRLSDRIQHIHCKDEVMSFQGQIQPEPWTTEWILFAGCDDEEGFILYLVLQLQSAYPRPYSRLVWKTPTSSRMETIHHHQVHQSRMPTAEAYTEFNRLDEHTK